MKEEMMFMQNRFNRINYNIGVKIDEEVRAVEVLKPYLKTLVDDESWADVVQVAMKLSERRNRIDAYQKAIDVI